MLSLSSMFPGTGGVRGSKISRLYSFLFSILLFFTPLVFVNNTGELYEFPKLFFVYGVGGFIVFTFGLDVLLGGRKVRFPEWPASLLLVFAVISTLFSMHRHTSFWGYYSRFNDGLLSLMMYFGLYIVARSVLNKENLWELLKLIILGSLLVSLYGISQHFSGITRVYATFGQPNWLAHYLGMLLPLMLLLFFKSNRLLTFWYLPYFLSVLCLWLTYSISGYFGAMVGCGVALFYMFFSKATRGFFEFPVTEVRRSVVRKVILLLLPVFFSFSLFPGIFKERLHDVIYDLRSVQVARVYAVASSTATTDEDGHALSDSGTIRAGLWEGTWKLIISSPKVFLIGAGPETFPYVFQQFRSQKLNYTSEWDYVFNKPHNYFLELWVEQGLLGLVAFMFWGIYLLRFLPKYLVPSVITFFITSFFGWPTVAPFLLFWFMSSFTQRSESVPEEVSA